MYLRWHDIIWLLAALTVFGFITLAIITSVENGVKGTGKFVKEHKIEIPKGR